MDIQKQVDYWRIGSKEDMSAAQVLFDKRKFRHCLFFAHLALEKALKAHVSLVTADVPPKIHNLVRLAELSRLEVSEDRLGFLRRFNLYQLEGRYPEQVMKIRVTVKDARELLSTAKEMRLWLTKQL